MEKSKKSLIVSIVIVVIVIAAAIYYFGVLQVAKPIVWDGSYKMTGDLPCTGNFPNLTTVPMDSTFTVSNNKIQEPTLGKSFDIDKNGKAVEAAQATNGGINTDIKADYQFYQENGVSKFTANGSITLGAVKDGTTYSSTCAGVITGNKQ